MWAKVVFFVELGRACSGHLLVGFCLENCDFCVSEFWNDWSVGNVW